MTPKQPNTAATIKGYAAACESIDDIRALVWNLYPFDGDRRAVLFHQVASAWADSLALRMASKEGIDHALAIARERQAKAQAARALWCDYSNSAASNQKEIA